MSALMEFDENKDKIQSTIDRFPAEAESMAQVRHQNVERIHDGDSANAAKKDPEGQIPDDWTEKMLRDRIEGLERSNKNLKEFAYVAAHELKEPLVGIAAYLKILEQRCKGRLDSEAKRLVSRALRITLRMDSLVQSLLAHSRFGAGRKSFQPTDCNGALLSAVSSLRSAIAGAGAKVTSDLLPTVTADPTLITQLFQHLVSNALKFASDSPLEIHVGAARKKSEWQFYVRDNGIGIEPPYFDRIFGIFQRLEASGGCAGTGIGLPTCKKIVEHHGGRIWVESEPGKGSIFFFTVPDRELPQK
jgi:light-regulated signal transduction histidine kinase (bacteriophytochrome)